MNAANKYNTAVDSFKTCLEGAAVWKAKRLIEMLKLLCFCSILNFARLEAMEEKRVKLYEKLPGGLMNDLIRLSCD